MPLRLPARALAVAAAALACQGDIDVDQAFTEAEALYHRGWLTAAQERTRSALDPRAPAPDDARGWRLRLLGAEVLAELGQGAATRRLLEVPLPSAIAGGDLEARRQKILGQAAARARDGAEAARRFEHAARLARAATTPALPIEITYRQGALLADLGRREEAERASRSVIDMAAAAPEGKRWRAAAFITLGALSVERGRWVEALTFFEPALAQARALGAEGLAAGALYQAGLCHGHLGDFARARRALAEAAEIQQRLDLGAALVATMGALGKTALLSGDAEQAAADFERALARARTQGPATAAPWAAHLAATQRALERWELAARFNAEAAELWRQVGQGDGQGDGQRDRWQATALEEAFIARGRGDRVRAERLCQDLLARANRPGIRWAARAELAGLFAEVGRHAEAERAFTEAFAQIEDARANLEGVDARLSLLERLRRLHRDQVEWLVRRGRTAEALRAAELARARMNAERLEQRGRIPRFAIEDLRQRARRRGEVLVSIWVAPERSYAWIVRGGTIQLQRLPPERELRHATEALRAFLEQRQIDPRALERSPAHVLFDLVVRPLAVAPGSKVVIAADGPLQAVPWGALVAAGDPARYWMEQVTIALAPSLVGLPIAPEPARAPAAANLLAIGAAEGELSAVRRHFPASATTVLAGSLARPEAYLESDPGRFSIVHFAAAALGHPPSALDSNIRLSRGASGDRLSLRDLIRLPLDADLVSLSGCQGAGAGPAGLASGLLAAGARHVVAGLWSNEGPATALLLDDLYAEIARGAEPATALRSAQLRQLRWPSAWRAPFHWAAFQVYLGPGTPRESPLRSFNEALTPAPPPLPSAGG